MDVKLIKPYLHYPVGAVLDISRWLYKEKPEFFEIINKEAIPAEVEVKKSKKIK